MKSESGEKIQVFWPCVFIQRSACHRAENVDKVQD